MFNSTIEIKWKEFIVRQWELIISSFKFDKEAIKELWQNLNKHMSLKSIALRNVNLNDELFSILLDKLLLLQSLEKIDFSFNYLKLDNFGKFFNYIWWLKNLSCINLSYNNLTSNSISMLANSILQIKTLEYLNLYENEFNEESLTKLINSLIAQKNVKILNISLWHYWISVIPIIEKLFEHLPSIKLNYRIW